MRTKLMAASGMVVAVAYGLGTSGLPGPWFARLLEGLLLT